MAINRLRGAVLACLLPILAAAVPKALVTVNSMTATRTFFTATLLQNGKILVAGGWDGTAALSSCELYDPATGEWTGTGSFASGPRAVHTATLLNNGEVLVAGGDDGANYLATAEIYNPVTQVWTPTASLSKARENHTATLLRDGRVLVLGGYGVVDDTDVILDSAEAFNPQGGGAWSTLPPMGTPRASQSSTLLADGSLLVVGGYNFDSGYVASAQRFDPLANSGAGSWSEAGALAGGGRAYHTAVLLPGGSVLIAGGYGCTDQECTSWADLGTAETYDPQSNTWTVVSSPMVSPRSYHSATLLPNGTVLLAGGQASSLALGSMEIFDPAGNSGAGSFGDGGSLGDPRADHVATLLPDGHVLVMGGDPADFEAPLRSVEEYAPAPGYDNAWRPSITSASSPICLGVDHLLITGPTSGTSFQGVSEGSGGNGGPNSSTNYPLLQITDAGGRVTYLPVDPAVGWTPTSFQSDVVSGVTPGDAQVRIVTNGIPSLPATVVIEAPVSIAAGSPEDPAAVCLGSTATLTVSATGTGLSYQWYRGTASDESSPVGTDSDSYSTTALTSTTAYWVRVTGTCGSPADSRTATVMVAPLPVPTISGGTSNTCPGTSVQLSTEAGKVNYQWSIGGSPIEGATANSYTAATSGTYAVSYVDSCGELGTSEGYPVAILACLPPPETAPGGTIATAQSWSGKQTVTWPVNNEATLGYHLYRGVKADLPNLLNSTTDSCTRATTPDATSNSTAGISEDPSTVAGRFYWYLVTGLNGTGEGSAGNATADSRIVNSTGACP